MNLATGRLLFIMTCFTCWCALLPVAQAEGAELKFLTHSVRDQGYLDDDGDLRGREHAGRRAFNVELVREMMREVEVAAPIREVPLKRALFLVTSEPGYVLFNLNRTAEREAQMKWVGPLQSSITHFYENKDAPANIRTLEDAKAAEAICVLQENVHHRLLKSKGFTNIFPANSYASCIRMLSLQRVTLTPLSNISSVVMNPEQDFASKLQKTPVKLSAAKGYMAFSKDTPDEVINKWQAALDKLKASGRYQELLELFLDTE